MLKRVLLFTGVTFAGIGTVMLATNEQSCLLCDYVSRSVVERVFRVLDFAYDFVEADRKTAMLCLFGLILAFSTQHHARLLLSLLRIVEYVANGCVLVVFGSAQ